MIYWRVRPDRRKFRVLVDDGNPYNSQDFLEISNKEIFVNNLNFKIDNETNLELPDIFPTSHPGILCARYETLNIFGNIINIPPHIFYPIMTNIGEMSLYTPLYEEHAFDYEKSEVRRYDDGELSAIVDIKIKTDFRAKYDIFRLGDEFLLKFEIIVSDRFKYIYDKMNLKGLVFHIAS